MSGPNAALALPLEDRPPDLQPKPDDDPTATPELALQPAIPAGLILEIERLSPMIDDLPMRWHRDIKSADNIAALQSFLRDLSARSSHALKTATDVRAILTRSRE